MQKEITIARCFGKRSEFLRDAAAGNLAEEKLDHCHLADVNVMPSNGRTSNFFSRMLWSAGSCHR